MTASLACPAAPAFRLCAVWDAALPIAAHTGPLRVLRPAHRLPGWAREARGEWAGAGAALVRGVRDRLGRLVRLDVVADGELAEALLREVDEPADPWGWVRQVAASAAAEGAPATEIAALAAQAALRWALFDEPGSETEFENIIRRATTGTEAA